MYVVRIEFFFWMSTSEGTGRFTRFGINKSVNFYVMYLT